MKKKIFLGSLILIILVLGIFSLTGCGAKKEENKEQATQVVDETLVKINGLEFHLNKEAEFKGLKYVIANEFKEVTHDRYVQYNYYQEDSTNLLFYRVFHYENQGKEKAIEDLGLDSNIELKDGKTDNIEYKFYEQPRNDGGTIHFYFIEKDGNTYVVNFVSKYDIKDFEEKVVKSVKF